VLKDRVAQTLRTHKRELAGLIGALTRIYTLIPLFFCHWQEWTGMDIIINAAPVQDFGKKM
jgi:hypothetical protein